MINFYLPIFSPWFSRGRVAGLLKRAVAGFTLVETLIALGVTGAAVTVLYAAFTKMNDFAQASRINSCAAAIVQARLDKALAIRPFVPITGADPLVNSGSNTTPSDFMLCGTNTVLLGTPCTETVNILIDSDALSTSGTVQVIMTGTLSTLVDNASIQTGGTTASSGTVQLRRVNLNLNYQFRGRNYNVQMTCLRAPDV